MAEQIKKAWVDHGLEKLFSRKLLLVIAATVFFCLNMLDSSQWLFIAMAWAGIQGSIDFLKMWRTTGSFLPDHRFAKKELLHRLKKENKE